MNQINRPKVTGVAKRETPQLNDKKDDNKSYCLFNFSFF